MAHDRYDSRRGPRDPSRFQDDDRYRESGGRFRQGGDREERGFFERAGEQIASWFGDDDDDERYRRDRMPPREREQSGWSSARQPQGWGTRVPEDREYGGDRDYRSERSERGERGSYRPLAGDYGRSEGLSGRSESPWSRDEYRRTSFAGSSGGGAQSHDPHYSQWRQRQIDDLDRDYDEYRREHQSKFENDFGSWRSNRQTKRQMLGQVREHMEVVGSDEQHVGTVDRVAGDRIILTKSDEAAGGTHHSLRCTDIDRIEGDRVFLGASADEARRSWRDEGDGRGERGERALFEREDQGQDGPHMLDRSFSGTYR